MNNKIAHRQTVLLNGSLASSLINFRKPLIEALIAANHAVHVSAPNIGEETRRHLEGLGAIVHQIHLSRTGLGLISDLAYCIELRRLLRKIGADTIINYTIKPNIWGSFAAAGLKTRSVLMVTGLGYAFIEGDGLKRRVVRAASKILYTQACLLSYRVIFQNSDDLNYFVNREILKDATKAGLVNGSGVDLCEFTPAELPDEPVFLMIARLILNKGIREYAAAAKIVKEKFPSAEFYLAGPHDEGPDSVSEEELASWKENGVHYLGELKDVRPALASCSVYVLTSYREGTPRTVLEAMAMGRAIITTDAAGCRETVVDGKNGLLVPVADPAGTARAMEILAADKLLRETYGKNSREIVKAKYESRDVAHSVMRISALATLQDV